MAEWDEIKNEIDNSGRDFARDSGIVKLGIPKRDETPLPPYVPSRETLGIAANIMKPGPGMPTSPGQFPWSEETPIKGMVSSSTAIRGNIGPTIEDRKLGYETERAPLTATTFPVSGITPPATEGPMYQYTQPNGTMAYTDSLDKVPANLRDTVESRVWSDVGKNKFNVVTGESLAGVGERGIGQLFGGSQVSGGGGGGEAGYTGGYVGGIPSGQKYYESLSSKEEALYGPGGKPQRREFNQEEFNKVIGSLGGRASPKLRANIYQTMLTDIEHHNKAIDELQKANQQFGENSIQATQAKATLEHQREMADIARREHPINMGVKQAQTEEIKARTGILPAQEARSQAEADLKLKTARQMDYVLYQKDHFKRLESLDKDIMMNPEEKQKRMAAEITSYENRMSTMRVVDNLRQRHPDWNIPDDLQPGQTFEIKKGKMVKYLGGSNFEPVK